MYRFNGRNPWYLERSETQRMSGAVREIEAAVEGVRLVLSVFEPGQSGPYKTRELVGVRRLAGETTSRAGETLKPRRHARIR